MPVIIKIRLQILNLQNPSASFMRWFSDTKLTAQGTFRFFKISNFMSAGVGNQRMKSSTLLKKGPIRFFLSSNPSLSLWQKSLLTRWGNISLSLPVRRFPRSIILLLSDCIYLPTNILSTYLSHFQASSRLSFALSSSLASLLPCPQLSKGQSVGSPTPSSRKWFN